jgi:hypothetical protein
MSKSDFYKHIEYQYPDKHLRIFGGRLSFIILYTAGVLALFIFLYKKVNENELGFDFIDSAAYLLFAMMLAPFCGIFWFWLLMDNIKYFKSPVKCYKAMSKIVINHDGISICVYKFVVRQLKWKDIEIIEKSRIEGERVITLISNPLNERVVVISDRRNNYIQIPSRPSVDSAIKRFSNMEITIADPNVNRYIKDNR